MKIKKCRICGNTELKRIGSLGSIAMSNFTKRPSHGIKSPLSLVYCGTCTLLQLEDNPSRHTMYEAHYWYESRLNPTIVADLNSVVNDGIKLSNSEKNIVWLDIGANDGTLLSLVPKSFYRIGVDPAVNLTPLLKKHADKTIQGFFDKVKVPRKADIITAIAMFYDLPDPNSFTKKLKEALTDNGIIIIQLMTLAPMIEQNDVGNICHEHIEYYSYKSLVVLFEQHDLEIFKISQNSMNGGSYRIFLRHKKQGSIPFEEKKYTTRMLQDFFNRVEKNKKDFLKFVKECKKNNKTIIAYGASTKGNTILQYYGLGARHIPAVVDINPEKTGRYLIHSGIPIVNTIPPCDYLWILPYAFADYFQKKEKEFKKNGGKFVVSTPKFKIL